MTRRISCSKAQPYTKQIQFRAVDMGSSCCAKTAPKNPVQNCCSAENSKANGCCSTLPGSTEVNSVCCDKARPALPASKCCCSEGCSDGNGSSSILTQKEATSACAEQTQSSASTRQSCGTNHWQKTTSEAEKDERSDEGSCELSCSPSVLADPASSECCSEGPSGLQNCCNGLTPSKPDQHVYES